MGPLLLGRRGLLRVLFEQLLSLRVALLGKTPLDVDLLAGVGLSGVLALGLLSPKY